jgi:acetyl-CoA decarbonylase/synthase complex subunit gamma
LGGRDGWILVLDTKGVNVWCAAGKGTFGTAELVKRLEIASVKEVVSHHTLILPQLGATGVSAHEVKRLSGFRVVYGPVLAKDLPAFLDAGMKATPEMRQVRFPFMARIVLAPQEIVGSAKYALFVAVILALLSGLGSDGYDLLRVTTFGLWSAALILISWLAGASLTPALLPWLPARSFSAKGGLVGLLIIIAVAILMRRDPGLFVGPVSALSWLFIIPAITSFLGMNFTGASTYTSLSGVRKEMRLALPMQISSAVVGLGLWITGLFV